ncbi:MAG: hypothetical protein ACRD11_02050 [Terriglobia bacterium]
MRFPHDAAIARWFSLAVISAFLAPGLVWGAAKKTGAAATIIPAGTRLDVQLTTTVSSSANQQGDPFLAEIEQPLFASGQEVVPAGSTLRGHVTFVLPPGRVKGKAEMRLVADSITTKAGKQFVFAAQLAQDNSSDGVKVGSEGTVIGAGKSKKDAARDAAIGAGAGAGIGGITDGGQGALYGAGIGAVAAAIHTLAKHHKNVVLDAGTELTFVLTSPMVESHTTKTSTVSVPFICSSCK